MIYEIKDGYAYSAHVTHWEGSRLILDSRGSVIRTDNCLSPKNIEVREQDLKRWIDKGADLSLLYCVQKDRMQEPDIYYLYPQKIPTPQYAAFLKAQHWIFELNQWVYNNFDASQVPSKVPLFDREKNSFMNAGCHKKLPNSPVYALRQIEVCEKKPDFPSEIMSEIVSALWKFATANSYDGITSVERLEALQKFIPGLVCGYVPEEYHQADLMF